MAFSGGKDQNMKKTLRREHMGYVYILPWIIGFLVFQLYPLAASLY